MTSSARHPSLARAALAVALAALGVTACGNYSNDDLEFVNAVPDSQDLTSDLPARPASTPVTAESELSRATHDASRTFNFMLDVVLRVLDAVRADKPASGDGRTRVWGPRAAAEHPGWDSRFTVTRTAPKTFTYLLEFRSDADPTGSWLTMLTGMFEASTGARRGTGSLHASTHDLREAGFSFDANNNLATMDLDYATGAFPVTADMTLATFVDPSMDLVNTSSVECHYAVASTGAGALGYGWTTAMNQTLAVNARWLPSGAGMATATVASGGGAGMTQTECWDASFRATYNDKPWSPTEDLGDPSTCPAISAP